MHDESSPQRPVMEHVGMSLTHTVWTCVIQTKHISTRTTEILKYAKIRFYFFLFKNAA